jgi:hypothetical protein
MHLGLLNFGACTTDTALALPFYRLLSHAVDFRKHIDNSGMTFRERDLIDWQGRAVGAPNHKIQ